MVIAGMILSLAELLEGTNAAVYQYAASDVNRCSQQGFGESTGLYKRKYYQRRGKGHPLVNFFQAHIEMMDVPMHQFESYSSPLIASAAGRLARAMKQSGIGALKPAAGV